MKAILWLLLALAAVTSAAQYKRDSPVQLLKRKALFARTGGRRGGRGGDEGDSYSARKARPLKYDSDEDTGDLARTSRKTATQKPRTYMPGKSIRELSEEPDSEGDGRTGYYVSDGEERVYKHMGNRDWEHGDNIKYNDHANPERREKSYSPVSDDSDKEENRKISLRGVKPTKDFPDEEPYVRDEKTDAALKQEKHDKYNTVMKVPPTSSRREGRLSKSVRQVAREKGYKVVNKDNRSGDYKDKVGEPLKGPKVDGWPEPRDVVIDDGRVTVPRRKSGKSRSSENPNDYQATTRSRRPAKYYDVNYSNKRDESHIPSRRVATHEHAKRDGITVITNPEQHQPPAGGNASLSSQQAEYQTYLDAFDWYQSEGAARIWPFLDQMTNDTDAPIVYDAAWSLLKLIYMPVSVLGPFDGDFSDFDWWEDFFAWSYSSSYNGSVTPHNATFNDSQLLSDNMAVSAIVINLYEIAYNQSMTALSKDNFYTEFETLVDYLDVDDESIIPQIELVIDENSDYEYFTTYNESGDHGIIINDSSANSTTSTRRRRANIPIEELYK